MVERIREILQVNQLTPTQFADSIGVARPIISHILSGRNKPSLEVVQKIVTAFPQLSLDWLLRGMGPMLAVAPATTDKAPTPALAAVGVPASRRPAPKVAKAPRYQPQANPAVWEGRPEVESSLEAPLAPYAAPAVPAAVPTLLQSEELGKQSAVAPAAVGAIVEPVAAVSAMPAAPAVPDSQALLAPNSPADISLASAFAEPGKVIRRIVIFYQDGTFTDYQPERHAQ